jgi:hypothetical protein
VALGADELATGNAADHGDQVRVGTVVPAARAHGRRIGVLGVLGVERFWNDRGSKLLLKL